ncbi:unnamed protein product [Lepeophtheirus salmonis]|uniref:(salmon louse) hypothetical protein n=1 Tax=Lepeophtheirus salmonis TaxID=72036 RepID=A0A7R8CTF9_LEPSM|nr:unnamed protein product [Lepeophtheirus salmonis]CAF2890033.1 unnamed protein product [Lepeophtheirus salmonis]
MKYSQALITLALIVSCKYTRRPYYDCSIDHFSYSIIGGVPLSLYDPAAPSPQTRDIGASGGLNLGPLGAGFGAGVRPGGFYLGGGAGYSGNFFLPYNYQQHQAPYLYTRHFNQTVSSNYYFTIFKGMACICGIINIFTLCIVHN